MSTRKTYISTFEAAPGMHLAKALCQVRNHRMFKLPAGTELTDEIIVQMKAWDISCIQVEEADDRTAEQLLQDRLRIEESTHTVFGDAEINDSALGRLYQATLSYRLEHA